MTTATKINGQTEEKITALYCRLSVLSIYKTGSKEGLVVAMNAALPFMDGEMRDFAARTLAKVGRMTEAEFAGLALYPADEV